MEEEKEWRVNIERGRIRIGKEGRIMTMKNNDRGSITNEGE